MTYTYEFLKFLQDKGITVFIVHTVYPYDEGNVILGYVLSLTEFDEYASKTFGITPETKFELDGFGKGSKQYNVSYQYNLKHTHYYDLVCEPLKHLG